MTEQNSFPSEFQKKYDPKEAEKRILSFWEEKNIYAFDEKSDKELFSIDTPPPTMSGRMHIGHAFGYSQQDFIARFKKMTGHNVYYPFGTDDNGLATEKLVQKEKKVDLRKVSREEAIKVVLDFLNTERPKFIQDWKNIGMSCDFNYTYTTISDYSRKISQKSFIDLYKKGRIYRKTGPVMWDRVFQTAIAQAELEDKSLKSTLNYIKAKFKGTENTYLIYATTRPELLHACVGMSIEDKGKYVKLKVENEYWITGANTYKEKFKNFTYELVEELIGEDIIGETIIIPISENEVEIDHDISVKADYGTGIVYYCTYGGLDCVEWMARHPKLEPISILTKDGKLNEKCGKFEGLVTTDARAAILEELEKTKELIQKENIEHIVNVGERSGVEVEYIVAAQWYVKYLDKKEYFFEMANKFNFFPKHMVHRLENWIKGLNWDWGFSRQRHYGIPVPTWYDKDGNVYLPDEDQLPVDPLKDRPKSAPQDIELFPETDVFDTWFTSASSPFLAINQVENTEMQKRLFPMNLRPQGHDIINFWLFYTMAKTNLLTEENPFKDVTINGWVLAADGSKMSKSKGNTISPQEKIEQYSADALRWGAASTKLGDDLPFPEKELVAGGKVINKLYNANKFAAMLLKDFTTDDKDYSYDELLSIDKWILAKAAETAKEAKQHLENYDYQKAKALFEQHFMSDIADNYIEIVKARLWNPDQYKEDSKKAQKALYHALYSSLRGLAPFLPFISEEIYQIFYKQYETEESIHLTSWPEQTTQDKEAIILGNNFIEILSQVRRYKAEKQVSMKAELEKIQVTCTQEEKQFIENSLQDLKAVTGAKEIEFEEGEFKVSID
ncbi:class I tRNA ligase family protein [Candidatus Woesearchaeota archaeon]|nr:class I tRNA ligase family protein [Nanoarchaeota archaeon]MCB9371110.1 class I tRNA ligase family protein [Candidatus Woesearchaeota archaeon]USN44173.1 MAG: class I tRNA ligase family protein [Candidatus Woesearchaeota archaeon]